jgi:hypothetical protein
MKIILIAGVVMPVLFQGCGSTLLQEKKLSEGRPHLELELSSQDYQALLSQRGSDDKERPDLLDDIVRYGGRMLKWVDYLNARRPTPLELTSAETQIGYPVDQPKFSNVRIVEANWSELASKLPSLMTQVIVEGNDFVDLAGLSDEDFLENARSLNMIYQSASRWILQEPVLASYAARSGSDIRGYYFFKGIENLESFLKTDWSTNPSQSLARDSLVNMCNNTRASRSKCKSELDQSEAERGEVYTFYQKYLKGSKEVWDSYFEMSNPRSDVSWSDALMTVPFANPRNQVVQDWLQVNVEDEWRFGDWQLKLNFKDPSSPFSSITRIKFEPGTTPHVNGIGGSTITMDANLPLQEYNSRWTIRHEYGHVLGFPDCYVEFYDTDARHMVSYQLDITNLMCSRRGHLKQEHFDRLKSAYATR